VSSQGLGRDLGPFHFTFGRPLLRLLLPLEASLSEMFDIFMEPRRRLIALHECGGAFRLLFVRYLWRGIGGLITHGPALPAARLFNGRLTHMIFFRTLFATRCFPSRTHLIDNA
jgi:hypothetical protein